MSTCYIIFRHGTAERVYRLEFVSNQGFSDTEFSKWKETIYIAGMQLPTKRDVELKLLDIRSALNYKFKETDIEKVYRVYRICIV